MNWDWNRVINTVMGTPRYRLEEVELLNWPLRVMTYDFVMGNRNSMEEVVLAAV